MKFKKILAPTDFSQASLVGLKMAKSLAEVSQGEILILFVEEPVWDHSLPIQIKDVLKDYNEALHQHAKKRLMEIMEKDLQGIHSYYAIGNGHAVDAILEAAEKYSMDLICMATRGWSNQGSGSITERVVRNSNIPVLVVPNSEKEKESETVTRPMGVQY